MQQILFMFILLIYLPVNATSPDNTYGPIRGRDRLWDIATRVRPEPTITRYQAILALLKANPHAFSTSCNINSLKIGQTLHIPSSSEMKQLSPPQAEAEYHRQNGAWKAYRRQGQQIHCPSPEESQISPLHEPAEPILSVIRSALAPPVSNPPPPPAPTVPEKPKPVISSSFNHEDSLGSPIFSSPHSLIIILTVGTLFLLAFSIGWLFHRHITTRALVKQNRLDSLKDSLNQHKINLKKKNEFSNIVPNSLDEEDFSCPAETTEANKTTEANNLKNKLAYIRTYLAEGEGKAVEKFLKDVIEEGTPEQREEAKQLIEINKKMSTLELYIAKNQSLVAHNPLLQEILQVTQHLPTLQYLPENEGKVIDLVDKIFEFLDHELEAQGKLMEAYTHRYKPKFFETKNYTVVGKNEKILTEDELNPLESRLTPKPTRFL